MVSTYPEAIISIDETLLDATNFDVVFVPRGNWDDAVSINEFINSIGWSYAIQQAAIVLSVEITFDNAEEFFSNNMEEGDFLLLFGYVYENNGFVLKELYRTTIIEISRQSDPIQGVLYSVTAYDPFFYAQNNIVTEKLEAGTATAQVKYLSDKYGIPFDDKNSVDTVRQLPVKVVRRSSVYQMMIDAIVLTNRLNKEQGSDNIKTYLMKFVEGKLRITERTIPDTIWSIEEGSNLLNILRRTSIAELKNDIRVLTGNNALSGIDGFLPSDELLEEHGHAVDEESISRYGRLIETIEDSSIPITDAQNVAESALRRMQKRKTNITTVDPNKTNNTKIDKIALPQESVSIRCSNINGLHWGDPVWIFERKTLSIGVYFIVSGKHTINANGAIMELILSKVDEYDLLDETLGNMSKVGASILDKLSKSFSQDEGDQTSTGFSMNKYEGAFLSYPFNGFYGISQKYGIKNSIYTLGYHPGIDFGLLNQTQVIAAAPGQAYIYEDSVYGKYIDITHSNGLITRYAHLDSYIVDDTDMVERGEPIALSGYSGLVIPPGLSGAHLHFELRRDNKPIDPTKWFVGVN